MKKRSKQRRIHKLEQSQMKHVDNPTMVVNIGKKIETLTNTKHKR